MTDEERVLRLAREAWRSSRATEGEVALGVERVAGRFAMPKRMWPVKSWATAGATAAVLGALAHGAPSRLASQPAAPGANAISIEIPAPTAKEVPTGSTSSEGRLGAPSTVRHTEGDLPAEPTADSTVGSPAVDARRRPRSESSRLPARDNEPSWIEVNDALAALDHARAEKLLNELALHGHDSNTRAKGHLGLAQLEEARQNCDAARSHALRAAAMPDVEIKTIRRALELAARCAR